MKGNIDGLEWRWLTSIANEIESFGGNISLSPYDKRQFTATEYHNITNITNRLIFVHLASEIINFL